MLLSDLGDEGGTLILLQIATDVAGGADAMGLKAGGECLQAEHQVLCERSIVLSEARKHN